MVYQWQSTSADHQDLDIGWLAEYWYVSTGGKTLLDHQWYLSGKPMLAGHQKLTIGQLAEI
jgi:hypothetical protein